MALLDSLYATLFDLLPIVAILFVMQYGVIRRPIQHLRRVILGFGLVLAGLSLFLLGLDLALFPLGELMAFQLSSPEFLPALSAGESYHWRDYAWVYAFAFLIGASTTIAEPALIAVSIKAGEISGGTIDPFTLRLAVAFGMAFGIALGAWRIIVGIPLVWLISGAYVLVIVQTFFAPRNIIPLAFDSGGVTTSTITVPIITALGLGLASQIEGRNPLTDGFGMIALACLFPIISVMGYAQIARWRYRRSQR